MNDKHLKGVYNDATNTNCEIQFFRMLTNRHHRLQQSLRPIAAIADSVPRFDRLFPAGRQRPSNSRPKLSTAGLFVSSTMHSNYR